MLTEILSKSPASDPALSMYVGSLVGAGTMSWHGAYAGWFWIDRANDVVCVGMAQRLGAYPDYVFDDINQVQTLVYQALTHPER